MRLRVRSDDEDGEDPLFAVPIYRPHESAVERRRAGQRPTHSLAWYLVGIGADAVAVALAIFQRSWVTVGLFGFFGVATLYGLMKRR